MAITHHEELRAFQLCCVLRDEVSAIFARSCFGREGRFREDFQAALDSAPNNIAEGFWRYTHPEFARFTAIARSSVGESQSHLLRALKSRYISEDEYARFRALADQSMRSVTKLLTYLRSTPTPGDLRKTARRRP